MKIIKPGQNQQKRNKKTLEKINKTKCQFSVKINTVNRYFARLIQIKEGEIEA